MTLREAAKALGKSEGHLYNICASKNPRFDKMRQALNPTWNAYARRWEFDEQLVEAYASTRKKEK